MTHRSPAGVEADTFRIHERDCRVSLATDNHLGFYQVAPFERRQFAASEFKSRRREIIVDTAENRPEVLLPVESDGNRSEVYVAPEDQVAARRAAFRQGLSLKFREELFPAYPQSLRLGLGLGRCNLNRENERRDDRERQRANRSCPWSQSCSPQTKDDVLAVRLHSNLSARSTYTSPQLTTSEALARKTHDQLSAGPNLIGPGDAMLVFLLFGLIVIDGVRFPPRLNWLGVNSMRCDSGLQ